MSSPSDSIEERFSDATRTVFNSLSSDEQQRVRLCVEAFVANPEPDGVTIFDDASMVPIMLRLMVCDGFVITFHMVNREARVYAIVRA